MRENWALSRDWFPVWLGGKLEVEGVRNLDPTSPSVHGTRELTRKFCETAPMTTLNGKPQNEQCMTNVPCTMSQLSLSHLLSLWLMKIMPKSHTKIKHTQNLYNSVTVHAVRMGIWNGNCETSHYILHFKNQIPSVLLSSTQTRTAGQN